MRLIYTIFRFNSNLLHMENKRTIESKGHTITQSAKIGLNYSLKPNPEFLENRLKQFLAIKEKIEKIYQDAEKPDIIVTLKDGKQIKGNAFVTTPLAIARGISKNLAENVIVAKVKYTKKYENPLGKGPVGAEVDEESHQKNAQFQLIDLSRPLEGDCELELLSFDDKVGKEVFWHSSAHLLGQSLEMNYGAWLCHGPPLEQGFFYDSFMGNYTISQGDYEKIQKEIRRYGQQKQPYERILLTKKEALEMFAYNPFKVQLIQNKVPQDGLTSAYRCGNLIDLCTGPHLPSADKIKGFKVLKHSSAYWLGKKQNDDLQRVYAISFPKQNLLDQYVKQQEELAKRDHRNIGPQQQLFNFTTLSPGCALFYPHGTIIYNRLIDLMRSEYKIRGYSEVISPNVYNSELWKISGHYFKYKENIFFIRENGEEHGLKPMNCPGHCVMFDLIQRSYRDLPIRMADFGVLHRNQLHGALSGLTRVRRFQQDDAHIFCMSEQIQQQILGCLDLLDYAYSVFGFKYVLELSTRPEKYLGTIEDWNAAENQLKEALAKFGKQYKINEGDGAFYGPKIDVKLFDTFGREHQCGTVQLDFQLPIRFNLQYRSKEIKEEKQIGEEDVNSPTYNHSESSASNKAEKKQKIQLTAEEIAQRKAEKLERDAKKKQEAEEAKLKNNNQAKLEQKVIKVEQKVVKEEVKVEEKMQIKQVKIEKHSENCCDHPEETIQEMQIRYGKIGHLKKGFVRPVIIHRAIFGSLERFIAILCQHTGGKWDFWVSPRQIQLIPIGKDSQEFTELVYNTLLLKNYAVSIDNSGDKLDKKIRNAQLENYNFIGVIGKEEVASQTVNLRRRDEEKEIGKFTIPEVLALFDGLRPIKSKKREALEKRSLI